MITGPTYALLANGMHSLIPSTDRVTTLSVFSLVGMLGAAFGSVVTPAIAERFSYGFAFLGTGLAVGVAGAAIATPSVRQVIERNQP
jgi:hypothetical protein